MADIFDPYYTWLGVPPEEQPPDHYRLLGVRRYETNRDVINNAADQRMAHIRTFQSGKRSAESQKLLNELAAAVVCLLNLEKKAAYDQQLRAKEAAHAIPPPAAQTPPPWQQPPPVAPPSPMRPLPMAIVSAPADSAAATTTSDRVVRVQRARGSKSNAPVVLGGLAAVAVALIGIVVWALNQSGTTTPAPVPRVAKGEPQKKEPVTSTDLAKGPTSDTEQPPATGETATKVSTPSTTAEPSTATSTKAPANLPPKPADDARTEWRFHIASRGTYRRTPEGWVLSRPGKPDELWEEVSRTEKYVEIKEPKAVRTMRLQQDSYTILTDGRWLGTKAGTWAAVGASTPTTNVSGKTKLSPELARFVPATAKPLDLLAGVDLETLRVSGQIEQNNRDTRLAATEEEAIAKVKFPGKVPPSYLLEVEFTPQAAGRGTLSVGLVVGGKSATFQIDAYPSQGFASGLEVLDGKRVVSLAEPLAVKGRLLTIGQPAFVAVVVQPRSVLAEVNGRRITTWEGEPESLSQAEEHAIPANLLGLTSYKGQVLLHSVRLTPLASNEARNVATSEPPFGSDSSPSIRLPVPTEEALDAARQRIKGAFGADVAKAVKPAEKVAVARQFLDAAKNETSPSVRYAVFSAARKLAISGGDTTLTLAIANDLGRQYETDVMALLTETITDLSKADLPTAEQEKLVDAALKTAHDALENEQAEAADGLSQIALTLANRAKDPARRKSAKVMRDEAVRFKDVFEAFRIAGELLEVDANDAKANLTVGKFYCFERRDWIRGRESLAKGSDAKLAAAAKAESDAADAVGNLAAADAWYDLRESFAARDKTLVERHAADLYELAVADLAGLDRAKADKRLTELKTLLVAADKTAADSGAPQFSSKKGAVKYIEGVMARAFITNGGRDVATPYVCCITNYSQLPDTEIKQMVADTYGPRPTTFYAVGYVVLDVDTELAIRLDSCTCKIGNDSFTAPAGSLQQNTKTIKKGVWPVVLTFKTTTISSRPFFSVTHVAGGKSALYYIEKEWLAESAKTVPLPNGGVVKSQIIPPR